MAKLERLATADEDTKAVLRRLIESAEDSSRDPSAAVPSSEGKARRTVLVTLGLEPVECDKLALLSKREGSDNAAVRRLIEEAEEDSA